MSELSIKIKNKNGEIISENNGKDAVSLFYCGAYSDGDVIILNSSEEKRYFVIQLDDAIPPAFVYLLCEEFIFPVPFNEKKAAYSPKSFSGDKHLLKARLAYDFEICAYKNLAKNEYDWNGNKNCFPHAAANVETRGEAVFAARNVIDGNAENHGHGYWPYESWGINCRDDAEIMIEFGRTVEVDSMAIYIRADFPHDNWWESVTFTFSDGTSFSSSLMKTDAPQKINFDKKRTEWVRMSSLIKSSDPSPFPALSQWEIYGREIDL
jgi:hypothetical protein